MIAIELYLILLATETPTHTVAATPGTGSIPTGGSTQTFGSQTTQVSITDSMSTGISGISGKFTLLNYKI